MCSKSDRLCIFAQFYSRLQNNGFILTQQVCTDLLLIRPWFWRQNFCHIYIGTTRKDKTCTSKEMLEPNRDVFSSLFSYNSGNIALIATCLKRKKIVFLSLTNYFRTSAYIFSYNSRLGLRRHTCRCTTKRQKIPWTSLNISQNFLYF